MRHDFKRLRIKFAAGEALRERVMFQIEAKLSLDNAPAGLVEDIGEQSLPRPLRELYDEQWNDFSVSACADLAKVSARNEN